MQVMVLFFIFCSAGESLEPQACYISAFLRATPMPSTGTTLLKQQSPLFCHTYTSLLLVTDFHGIPRMNSAGNEVQLAEGLAQHT